MNSLEKLQALYEAATPGPLTTNCTGGIWDETHPDPKFVNHDGDYGSAALIVALVNAAPELLAVVRAASRTKQDMKEHGTISREAIMSAGMEHAALEALNLKLSEVLT